MKDEFYMEAPWVRAYQSDPPVWFLEMPGTNPHALAKVLLSLPMNTKIILGNDDRWTTGVWYRPESRELFIL